ncbi:recombinase family protein [Phreatobacter oligotrophus]|uniref:DNA invertase Pin-like site-specific DNA recombinase n=1 Tax=Phreatobacter oligotrophus TaxID=1122261 RepID=A0A2T4Z280_9HYPH|nr:recombinase family protein [Phreatobacter oligotrophus]PTM54858.1 DNA invertase Pin-like site-specific DNA recombinase [Phreatobacter oligotrophus]
MSAVIGYARTSTIEQVAGLEAQRRDLERAGCTKVFSEQLSSVDAKRPELARAIEWAREGDVFVVTKPDRLARSTKDLLAILDTLQAKGVQVRILSMDLDTTTPTGRLMVTVLGAVAAFERDLMLERQREGIAKAKAEGKYKGRKPSAALKADDAVRLVKGEGLTVSAAAKALGIGRASVYRALEGK